MSGTVAQFPTTTPIIGQPFSFKSIGVPVNAVFTCNCTGGAAPDLTIRNSEPVQCPNCQKLINVFFNPTNGKLEMHIANPEQGTV